jgi:hypothetical protein
MHRELATLRASAPDAAACTQSLSGVLAEIEHKCAGISIHPTGQLFDWGAAANARGYVMREREQRLLGACWSPNTRRVPPFALAMLACFLFFCTNKPALANPGCGFEAM